MILKKFSVKSCNIKLRNDLLKVEYKNEEDKNSKLRLNN